MPIHLDLRRAFRTVTFISLITLALVIVPIIEANAQIQTQVLRFSQNAHARYQVSGTTYYLDAQNGNDNNPGTQDQPWRTVPQAIKSLSPGDTVIFNAGIYALDSSQTYFFGPSGVDVNHKTTYRAAGGARVIITGFDQKPVNIHLKSYMHVEGLWFGGSWDTVNGIDAFGHGEGVNPIFVLGGPLNDVVNCTFFGYGQTGNGGDYLLFQGNRSVRTGGGDLSHGIYLSGHDGTTNQEDNHAIVDNNIFIGQEIANPSYGKTAGAPQTYLMGLGIQAWHLHNNNIITRNFVTHHIADTIEGNGADNSVRSELVANNFWWENGMATNISYPDGFWITKHVDYWNNLGGPGGGIASSDIQQTAVGNTLFTNAFTLGISNHLPPNAPVVINPGPFTLSIADTAAAVGTTSAALDQTIAALQNAFAIGVNGRTIQALFQDQSVEADFSQLRFTTPSSSSLYRTGTAWFNPTSPLAAPAAHSVLNIGPDTAVPASAGLFWAAARALGLQDYDDSGKPVTVPYPAYPYGEQQPVNNPSPTSSPTVIPPTALPTVIPPSALPTLPPPSALPTMIPPSALPTVIPPTALPTVIPPSALPTLPPPSALPTVIPASTLPTLPPPSALPTVIPASAVPTLPPPSALPTVIPPSAVPTLPPPSALPTLSPPTALPTLPPASALPTVIPPSALPTVIPASALPTVIPPSALPTLPPASALPTITPTTCSPTTTPASDSPTQTPVAENVITCGDVPNDLNLPDPSLTNLVDPASALLGQKVTYTIILHAGSSSDVPDVRIADFVPSGLTITSASTPQGKVDISNNLAVFTLGALKRNQTLTVVINAEINADIVAPTDLNNLVITALQNRWLLATATTHIAYGVGTYTDKQTTPTGGGAAFGDTFTPKRIS